jgi:hypothetical protein
MEWSLWRRRVKEKDNAKLLHVAYVVNILGEVPWHKAAMVGGSWVCIWCRWNRAMLICQPAISRELMVQVEWNGIVHIGCCLHSGPCIMHLDRTAGLACSCLTAVLSATDHHLGKKRKENISFVLPPIPRKHGDDKGSLPQPLFWFLKNNSFL